MLEYGQFPLFPINLRTGASLDPTGRLYGIKRVIDYSDIQAEDVSSPMDYILRGIYNLWFALHPPQEYSQPSNPSQLAS